MWHNGCHEEEREQHSGKARLEQTVGKATVGEEEAVGGQAVVDTLGIGQAVAGQGTERFVGQGGAGRFVDAGRIDAAFAGCVRRAEAVSGQAPAGKAFVERAIAAAARFLGARVRAVRGVWALRRMQRA